MKQLPKFTIATKSYKSSLFEEFDPYVPGPGTYKQYETNKDGRYACAKFKNS
jgi:hypothetical protein